MVRNPYSLIKYEYTFDGSAIMSAFLTISRGKGRTQIKMASDILSLFCETTAPHLIKLRKRKTRRRNKLGWIGSIQWEILGGLSTTIS